MTRRSLNWRFLLITTVIGGTCAWALYVLHAWQLSRTAQGLLVLAEQHELSEDWLKAAEFLDRYLSVKPADTTAKIRLAQTYAKGVVSPAQKQRAIELHYRALAIGEKSSEIKLRCGVADLLLDSNADADADRSAEAERQARLVLALEAEQPQATRTLALALNRQLAKGSFAGQPLAKLRLLETTERACRLNPDDLDLAMLRASLLRDFPAVIEAERPAWTSAKREQEADQCLEKFVLEHPQLAKARLARYRYRTKYGLAEAQAELEAALGLAPNDLEISFTAAVSALGRAREMQRSSGDAGIIQSLFEQSEAHFERLISLLSDGQLLQAHLGLGDARLGLGDLDGALAAWRAGIERDDRPTARAEHYGRIAEATLAHDRLADAAAALDATDAILAKLGMSIPQSQFGALSRAHHLRRARWHIQRRAFASALPLLRTVLAGKGSGEAGLQTSFQASYLLGTVYGAIGEWLESAAAYERAASLQPAVQGPHLAAANAWLMAGRVDLARERAEQARAVAPTRDAWISVGIIELQFQRSRPMSDQSWTRLDEALAALEQPAMQSSSVPAWRVAFLRAESVVAKAHPDSDAGTRAALGLLQATEQQHAEDPEFMRQLCLVYQGLKLEREADRILSVVCQTWPRDIETQLVQARLLNLRGDDAAAAKLLQQSMQTAPPRLQEQVRSELLRTWLAARKWTDARAMLLQDQGRDPRNLAILRRLAEVDLERNDLAAVEKWEQQLREQGLVGQSLARYFRAWRLFRSAPAAADSRELREALFELEEVVLAQPNWAEAIALKGMTLQRMGRLEQAAADYERAVNSGDRRVFVFERLVALLDRLDRPVDIEKYLARLGAEVPLTQWLTEFASARELRNERPDQALELARKNAAQHPEDAAAQLWLGRLLMVANKTQDAEASFQRALELAPGNAQGWEALFALYRRSNNREQIRATLARLQSNSTLAPARRHLLIGQAHQALEEQSAAERNFAQAAAQDESSLATRLRVAQFYLQSDPAQAKVHLEAALRIAPDSTSAKQMLAIAQAASGEFQAAEALLSAADNQPAVAENVRLHALLLTQRGGAVNVQRAVRLLEDLVARKDGGQPVDRLLLARLYEQQASATLDDSEVKKQLAKAEENLTVLAGLTDANPIHIATLAQFFSRRRRADDAHNWLRKLEDRVDSLQADDPNAIASVIETQLLLQVADRSASWLTRLEKLEGLRLRPAALRARLACMLDANADVEAILEPQMTLCLAGTTTPKQRHQLYAAAGNIYRDLNRLSSAEQWYRKLMSESPERYSEVVGVLAAQKRVAEAIDLCQAAALTDDSPQPALVLAGALAEGTATEADFVRAAKQLAAAAARFDRNENLLNAVAVVKILRNDNSEAVTLLRRVTAINPRNVPALNNLALLLADKEEHRDEALRLIDEAMQVAGSSAGLLDTKGSILVYCGRSAEAIPLLQAATRDAQADPQHHFHLAIAYFDTGRIADAKQHMQIAMDRQLGSQVLTAIDRELLAKLLGSLRMEKPVSTTAVMR